MTTLIHPSGNLAYDCSLEIKDHGISALHEPLVQEQISQQQRILGKGSLNASLPLWK